MKLSVAWRRGGALVLATIVVASLSACGSSARRHDDSSAPQSAHQVYTYSPGTQNHFLEACELLRHENSEMYYSKGECSAIFAFTERHTSSEGMLEYIRSYANKAITENRFSGTTAEVQKSSIEWGFELFVAHSMKTYEETSTGTQSSTTPQQDNTTSTPTENDGSAEGSEAPSGCMPGTGPGTADPQCQPRPGSPDYQPSTTH
jgi:hypothetical protein